MSRVHSPAEPGYQPEGRVLLRMLMTLPPLGMVVEKRPQSELYRSPGRNANTDTRCG